ncbi:MAG TPA: PASTA domain-containing protein [Solirubrobacterales bacterium]|jgi:hypothetical protein|nr:PASTA domain-containing protein [Solirubrobacterales bacterium]
MLVINVGWEIPESSRYSGRSAPLQSSTLENALNYLRGPVNQWFKNIAPENPRQWSVQNGSSYMISPPSVLLNELGCNNILGSGEDTLLNQVITSGSAAAKAAGYDVSRYDVVIYVWSRSVCHFDGRTTEIGGKAIGLPVLSAARHELGHRLGLYHVEGSACTDGDGQPVTLSENCHVLPAGDPYDMMGVTTEGIFGAMSQTFLGWMPNQVVNLNGGDFTGTWTIRPLSEIGQSPRAIRLVDGPTTLWLEYRQPTGLEAPNLTGADEWETNGSPITYGLVIHREEAHLLGAPTSYLLDMTPGSDRNPFTNAAGDYGDFRDAPLAVGRTWANPLGEMKITLNSAAATGATVTISTRRLTVPDVRGHSLEQAEAILAAAGLRSAGFESAIDPTCAYLGVVAAESPGPGSRILPETPVHIPIGEKDLTRECL